MPPSFAHYLAQVRASIRELDVAELRERLTRAPAALTLIDCREADELAGGVIAGAITLPRGRLEQQIEEVQPDRDAAIAVYCAVGSRSALAVASLEALGYRDVVNVAGGLAAWTAAGYPVTRPRRLSASQRARYARQIVLPQVGEAGQRRLLDARVMLVGLGGLGSPTALYLAAAGVGTLGLLDDDVVDASNLQRQILHDELAEGRPKTASARAALQRLNSGCEVIAQRRRLDASNALELLAGWDVVVDGTDNFTTRYLINDACVLLDIPNVHGSIYHFDGQCSVFHHAGGPCYRCLYPKPPPPRLAPSCAEAGVLGAIPGVIGTLQATETLKLLLGVGSPLSGRLLSFDGLQMRFHELKIQRDPSCPVCGERPTISELVAEDWACEAPPG